MRIEVTQEDIDRGVRNCNRGCPVARAIRRCSGETCVSVGDTGCTVGRKRHTLPAEAVARIRAFDRPNGVMVPFAFDLDETDLWSFGAIEERKATK